MPYTMLSTDATVGVNKRLPFRCRLISILTSKRSNIDAIPLVIKLGIAQKLNRVLPGVPVLGTCFIGSVTGFYLSWLAVSRFSPSRCYHLVVITRLVATAAP